MAVKLSRDDVEAIARTVASEVGGNVSGDKTQHIADVVGSIVNRADLGYRGNSIQNVVNKPSQFSKISQVGGWEKWTPSDSKMTPAQYAAVRERVVSALGQAVNTGKVAPFTDFANYDASDAVNQNGWLKGFMADPRTVTVGDRRTGRSQSYGIAPGAPSPNPNINFAMDRNALYPGMAADTVDRNIAADQQAMGPQYTKPSDPGFFSLGGFMPQKPADMTLQQAQQPAYNPLDSIRAPSMDMASQLMSGFTPPASIPMRAPVEAGAGPQVPLHIANPAAPPSWPTPNEDPMSSMYGMATLAPALHAPWSVEGAMQPAREREVPAPRAAPPSTWGAMAGASPMRAMSPPAVDPWSRPQPLQAEAGAYAPPATPGWTVHDTPPGQFSLPGRQPSMGAFTQASTATQQAPQAGGWVARGIPSFNHPAPMAPQSTAQQAYNPLSSIRAPAAPISTPRAVPLATRSISAPPAAPHVYTKPESAVSPAAMPSWASLATAAATSAVPGLGMLAAMPATVALARKAMAALPATPQVPVAPPVAPVAPPVPKPVPLALPTPVRPRPVAPVYVPHPAAAPQIAQGQRVEANNPFTAAGMSLLGQSAMGKPMYGGGYINGVQQVFSGNRPSNAFGGMGYGNPFSGLAGLFGNGVAQARQTVANLNPFSGMFGGAGLGAGGSGSGGFGGSGGGGTFGGGGWGGGPGSPGHRDSSH